MSKKVKVFVAVLLALVLLAVGGVATVMAQDEPPPAEPAPPIAGSNDLLARVAEILGIPKDDLVNAFKQAQQEMNEEAFLRQLDKAVEKGRLTQDEANAIKEWWQQRPEVLGPGLSPRFFDAPPLGGGHMRGGYKFIAPWGRHMPGGPRGWHSDNTTQTG